MRKARRGLKLMNTVSNYDGEVNEEVNQSNCL